MEDIMAADWAGEFGDEYTDRNQDLPDRTEFFNTLKPYQITNVFEVGCNIGTNLIAIRDALGCDVSGCDINDKALDRASEEELLVYWEDATDLDHGCDEYDLVFTVGLLVHLNTPELIKCMREINRISSGLVMFAEYEGDDIEVPYRGNRGALMKRDYGGIYNALFPDAVLMDKGFLPREMGFDDVTYWIFYDSGDSTSAYGLNEATWEGNAYSDGQIIASSLTGQIGAVRADRLYHSSYGAGAG
jgi:pseudaminic acid biosynthesis-associated methylase